MIDFEELRKELEHLRGQALSTSLRANHLAAAVELTLTKLDQFDEEVTKFSERTVNSETRRPTVHQGGSNPSSVSLKNPISWYHDSQEW
jgi:hypothetical protein